MNVAGIPLLAFLALSLVAALVVKFSPSLSVFSLFNALILVVILGNYGPPRDEVGGIWPSFQASYGEEEEEEEDARDDVTNDDSDDDNGDYGGDSGSDDRYEDDDDNGSDDEISLEDDEECDDDLDTRIEDFAKVVKGWREEWSRDKLQYG